jgi:imidazole glycerol-phosphate synthase subunit HisH
MVVIPPKVAIVDYALGNLYSIKHACERVGLESIITSSKDEIMHADGIILPGMGAYGDAMQTLHKLDLVAVLRDYAASDRPLIGICLGIQLLLSESHEFGKHKGLGIIEGAVIPLDHPHEGDRQLKIPQVGWNQIHPSRSWNDTPLKDIPENEYMYFVHSFIPQPKDTSAVLATTNYGGMEFCSSIQQKNIFACLFHPERSGIQGLKIYKNIARQINRSLEGMEK